MSIFDHPDEYHKKSETQRKQGELLIELIKKYMGKLNIRPELVLDIGCGTGALTKRIWKTCFPTARVIGIDVSEDMIKKAKQDLPPDYNIEYIHADILDFRYPSKFDIAYSNAVMHWIQDQRTAYKNIHNLLKENGLLVVHQGYKGCYSELRNVAVEVIKELGLSDVLKGFKYPLIYHSEDSIKELLDETGFKTLELVVTEPGVKIHWWMISRRQGCYRIGSSYPRIKKRFLLKNSKKRLEN